MKSVKIGSFKVFIDGVYFMTVCCPYGDVFDLLWCIHDENPTATFEIVAEVD